MTQLVRPLTHPLPHGGEGLWSPIYSCSIHWKKAIQKLGSSQEYQNNPLKQLTYLLFGRQPNMKLTPTPCPLPEGMGF
jgi:hypothetical protein